MRHVLRRSGALVTCFVSLLLNASAYAQTPAAPAPAAAPQAPPAATPAAPAPGAPAAPPVAPAAPVPGAPSLTPPKLVQSVEPVYPEAERARGAAASVGLSLTLDAEGHVTDAVVSQSAGAEFDAAALTAARQLVFEPALRDGKPVPAKIPFRFDFSLAPAAPGTAAPGTVPATGADAAPSAAATPPAEAVGGAVIDVTVEGERPPREPTKRVMEAAEITKIPGTNGDALRSVTNLPGLARPPGLLGLLIVRGSAPQDTQVFIDGTNVPIAYHFGGISSVVPSEMLERIDFYPGNFGPEYGRASGGIVDVGIRSPRKEGYGGLLQLDFFDARILAEGALGKNTRFMLGGRRSWVDVWLGPVLESAGLDVSVAPVYYDYQAMLEHDLSSSTTLRLFAFGSLDRLELLLKSPVAADPAFGGAAKNSTAFWRVQARADTRFSERVRWVNTVSVGNDDQEFAFGNIDFQLDLDSLDARSDLRVKLSDAFTGVVGLDIQTGHYDVYWRFPPIDVDRGTTSGPLFGRPSNELQGTGALFRPAAYALLEVTPLRGLKLFPGVRADYSKDTGDWTTDPRLGVRYDLPGGERRTTLKGGIGVYHQAPEPYESIEPFGSPGVNSQNVLQYSLGVEHELSEPVEISLEGFYKDLQDLVVGVAAADSASNGLAYENIGRGRSYGAELLLRYKPAGRFFGWLAYTLSKSERKDGPNEPWHTFDFDQTHILTALASVKGREGFEGWQLGARFRYVTGNPYTPYIGGILDYDAGAYAPIEDPVRYSGRDAAFHQLDFRIDKTWKFTHWQLGAYLDLQNVYNHQSPEGVYYNYNYSQRKVIPGLPLLPILGVRGEL